MFSQKDLLQIKDKGIALLNIEKQLQYFKTGFPHIKLVEPATPGNGIIQLPPAEQVKYIEKFEADAPNEKMVKFVPASGAATRMFKDLFEFLEDFEKNRQKTLHWKEQPEYKPVKQFMSEIKALACFPKLKQLLKDENPDFGNPDDATVALIIKKLLSDAGLNYANLPKGLIDFHLYPNGPRKALEEHLVEAALYCADSSGKVNVHFTVSPEHYEPFSKLASEKAEKYEKAFKVKYNLSYSIQKPSTDTIAVTIDNKPFRDKQGKLVFRPAGHGALIENLADLEHDIIFVKNIDNVVPDSRKEPTVKWKKILCGYLLYLKDRINQYLTLLDSGMLSPEKLREIINFCKTELLLKIPDTLSGIDNEVIHYLTDRLNRPVRVCGMVKNLGEPGGGPFWVKKSNGHVSLQIVEKSQINLDEKTQKAIFEKSTHFNPVDLVCLVKDYRGRKFNLANYTDPDTGFISVKSKDGKPLKAMELPGLWNGAMADWITVFIEVPIETFNPVKTINDLLRPEHR